MPCAGPHVWGNMTMTSITAMPDYGLVGGRCSHCTFPGGGPPCRTLSKSASSAPSSTHHSRHR
eukprot:11426196-Alexandrium_andersonii.AAC.1